MSRIFFRIIKLISFCALLFVIKAEAQTAGTLTFNFTQTATVGSATKNVMAVWVESESGTFIKTRMLFWGTGTNDHLPSWVSSSGINTVDAITGATLRATTTPTAFGSKSVSWDGTDISGNIVADGNYKIIVESAWCNPEPPDGQHKFLSTFSFVKGTSTQNQTLTDANLSGITLNWVPVKVSAIENHDINKIDIYPNPSHGIINLNFKQTTSVSKIEIRNIVGDLIYSEIDQSKLSGIKSINLERYPAGTYFIEVFTNDSKTGKKFKIVLEK
jgi:hypothetical protein